MEHFTERRFSDTRLRQLDIWMGSKTCDARNLLADISQGEVRNLRERWNNGITYTRLTDIMFKWRKLCEKDGLTGFVKEHDGNVVQTKEVEQEEQ